MLALIDESGDSGFKIGKGSSKYFTIALVIFEDDDEAIACDNRIEILKRELGWITRSEFHFKSNSDKIREAFFRAVLPYNFFYYGFVLNKYSTKLYGDSFKNKTSFYKYTCGLVFENAKSKLVDCTVIIDENGNPGFRKQLSKYLKGKMNTKYQKCIKKVKMESSLSNNLLQLADYVAGAINRSLTEKRNRRHYRNYLSLKEISVQIWPE